MLAFLRPVEAADPSDVFDIGVIGAGPAGSGAVWRLKNRGLRILWIDKDDFPRDKVCGDAIPYETYGVLDQLEPGAADELRQWGGAERILRSRVYLPSGRGIEIRWKTLAVNSARFQFDHWLVEKALQSAGGVHLAFGQKVTDIGRNNAGFEVRTSGGTFRCRKLIGAGGAHCPLARKANQEESAQSGVRKPERRHKLAAVRTYAEGVTGVSDINEVHALKAYLPGYFWIFPLPDGRVNLGLGILATELGRKKLDLKTELECIVRESPLAGRFSGVPLGSIQGFELPLGSSGSRRGGPGFLLAGDAASLIDPLDGHGIGSALHSGLLSADAVAQTLQGGDESTLWGAYQARLDSVYYRNHRLHRRLVNLAGSPGLLEILGRASLLRALGMDAVSV